MARQTHDVDERRLWKDDLVPIPPNRSEYHVSPGYMPQIRHLSMGQPLAWIRAGWSDLRRNPGVAIGYGAVIALLYAAIVALAVGTRMYHVGVQLTAGFVLLAPVMALGFYGVSLRQERNENASFGDVFRSWRQNPKGVLGIGVVMVLLFLTWFMVSMQATAVLLESKAELVLSLGTGTLPEFTRMLVTDLSIPVVLAYFGVGLLAVLVAFAMTAVSIPLLMENPETDAITAIVASWKAVVKNWRPMLWWAVLIAFFTGIGLALFYVGLVVIMPLLGFATWHAYRDTLGEWQKVEEKDTAYY